LGSPSGTQIAAFPAMDATTARPTLLSAARNFIRKSAGTAVLAIAPLAAVSLAPESNATAITTFGSPGLNISATSGATFVSGGIFPEGNRFVVGSGAPNNVTTTRFGVDGQLITTNGGGGITTTLEIFTAVADANIPMSTYLPLAWDFTLSKQGGSIGTVNWALQVRFTDDVSPVTIGSGSLTTGSATFTGTGSYTTPGLVLGDNSKDFIVFLLLSYSMTPGDHLFVGMNSTSQGITINAVPEPSTYAVIFGLGALGFVIVRRTRRSRAA
jgi:hypothetical protein